MLLVGCGGTGQPSAREQKLSEVEDLYNQEQYQNAMNVARFNLGQNQDSPDPASVVVVWKVQVLQGTNSIDYVQQFYNQAQERVKSFGPELVPYLSRALLEDPYSSVRLFSMYSLSEFDDPAATEAIAKVLAPDYTIGTKPSNITLEFLRSEAAMMLGARKHAPAYDGIITLTQSQDADVRAKAVMALGMLGDQRAKPILEQLHNDPDKWVAEMADSSMARIDRGGL